MKHFDRIEKMRHTCVAFGRFDGVHAGHQAVLRVLAEESKRRGNQSVVVSFYEDRGQEALTTEREKAYLMEKYDIDILISLCAGRSWQEGSVQRMLIHELGAELLVTEKGAEPGFLKSEKFPVKTVETVSDGGERITAEKIKKIFEKKDIKRVIKWCAHPFIIMNEVIHGKALGRTVGMPTANMKIDSRKYMPPCGVYATRTYVGGETFFGVTNVGTRPSVDNRPEITVETMLDDFDRDIYGEEIITEFHLFLREIRKFDGIEEVWRQVQKDRMRMREYFGIRG